MLHILSFFFPRRDLEQVFENELEMFGLGRVVILLEHGRRLAADFSVPAARFFLFYFVFELDSL